jgi:ribosomal protein L11 methyltransferase
VDWITLRMAVPAPAVDAVANFLFEAGAGGVITGVSEPQAATPAGDRSQMETHVPAAECPRIHAALLRYLAGLVDLGIIAAADARVDTEPLAAADWQASFRRQHQPIAIGRRLLVAPPWDVPAAGDRTLLVVEPGMAFGTGQHPTTRSCLEAIETIVDRGGVARALDVGTGSGVLAAALARLGVSRVVALDADVAVLPHARATLARNQCAHVAVVAGHAGTLRVAFDLVVANLLADSILAEADDLAARVRPGGQLVLSGILAGQEAAVCAAFRAWQMAARWAADEWRTVQLTRIGPC